MTFGQLWDEFLQNSPSVSRRLAEARVSEIWPSVVGSAVAARTESVRVEKGIMYVRITSSVARNEIFLRREELKDTLNALLGHRVINALIVK